MKLKVEVTVYKETDKFSTWGGISVPEEQPQHLRKHIIHEINIILTKDFHIIINPQKPIDSSKFRCISSRLTREINKNIKSIKLGDSRYYDTWEPWGFERIINVYYIDFDLESIKFSKEQKRLVKGAIDGKVRRDHSPNLSREKSQMEYRKRAYYGKCKRK